MPSRLPPAAAPLASVDMGSNSFRLEIGQFQHGRYRRIAYLKETVRLGAGLDSNSYLTEEAAQRGLACLSRFADRLQGFERSQVRAVATQTLREARNRDAFLRARGSGPGASDRGHLGPRGSPPDLCRRGPPAAQSTIVGW
jgi:exopolyphosphatase/guanosine-5'-triphosphate,3'-diphosphate pyrophosphatase